MTGNLRHWSSLEKTDPTATKPFSRAGGFKGTATKPIYHEKKMTEHFGPCGIGWGMGKPEFQLVPVDGEILVFCTVALWYSDDDAATGTVYGVGGDKVVARRNEGAAFVSDEAFKAAFTDALGNAMKHIGVGADIHLGDFDKYGRDEPVASRNPPPRAAAAPNRPRDAAPPASTPFDDAPRAAARAAGTYDGAPPSSPPPNGKAAPAASAVDPDRQAKHDRAVAIRDRIRAAIEKAQEPRVIEDVLRINAADLEFIKEFHEPTRDALVQFATARSTELLASA